jgi:hypothetical protein
MEVYKRELREIEILCRPLGKVICEHRTSYVIHMHTFPLFPLYFKNNFGYEFLIFLETNGAEFWSKPTSYETLYLNWIQEERRLH